MHTMHINLCLYCNTTELKLCAHSWTSFDIFARHFIGANSKRWTVIVCKTMQYICKKKFIHFVNLLHYHILCKAFQRSAIVNCMVNTAWNHYAAKESHKSFLHFMNAYNSISFASQEANICLGGYSRLFFFFVHELRICFFIFDYERNHAENNDIQRR